MAHLFAITSATDTVPLVERRGEITFTVTNSTGRPLRGRGVAIPLGSTKKEWLTLRGEAERDFSSSGTQQFTVEVAAPEGTPAGKYPFRLDVLSVVNPDEDFTEGPAVTAEIGASPPPPPKPSFPKWIIPVVMLVLLGGGVLTWLALRDTTPPSVEVLATPTATATATKMQAIEDPGSSTTLETATPTPTPTPTPFGVSYVTVLANPDTYDGKCPTPIQFTATITTNGPGPVQYRVDRKHGSPSSVKSVTIPPSQVLNVSWTENLGASGFMTVIHSTWQMVTIISPNSVQSNQATVDLTCRPL